MVNLAKANQVIVNLAMANQVMVNLAIANQVMASPEFKLKLFQQRQ
jgi:hypothetical protein